MPDNMGSQQSTQRGPSQQTRKATDPVCGMQVMPGGSFRSEYEGTTYEFCSQSCKQQFDRDPERYAMRSGGDRDETRPP